MIYQNPGIGSYFAYPNHDVNPDKKGLDWCKQYAEAAFYDYTNAYPKGIFSNNGTDYEKFKMYRLGKQPISPYQKWLGVDQLTNNTWLSLDWTPRGIISGYVDRMISELMQNERKIVATPVDSQAKSDSGKYYAQMKAKLAVRELMMQSNPELASHPLITLNSGEPLDVEELSMRMLNGEQFNRSEDAEMAIELGFYENDYNGTRKIWYEDLIAYGVAGYKEWLGDDNKAKFRRCNPDNVIVSYCKDERFKDMVHAGEVIDVSLIELALLKDDAGNPLFSEQELQEFASSIAGRFGNPAMMGKNVGFFKPYDKFKCKVFDISFYTYNDYSFQDVQDEMGNSDFRKAEYGRGKKSDKYKRKKIEFVYKCKWIVGTQKAYDFGMCYDQKRAVDVKKKAKTSLPYKFAAINFYEMRVQSFMEKLIPYIDEYQLTCLKIQNFKNRAVPSGWWIDLDRLENVALNKGGANMQPKELLQMFFETGVLVGRSLDAAGNPMNGSVQPVIPIENTAASELAMFYQDLLNTLQAIERITGFNEITNGNPNPKTLVPGYEVAVQSTKNALYPLAWAEKYLSEQLAGDVLCRMKQGIKKGAVDGYAPYKGALGDNTIRFIALDDEIADRDHGIELQEATTENQKIWILNQMQQDIAQGFLSTSDAVMIITTNNARQAMSILAYRVEKSKKALQQNELQKIQENNQGQQQTAQLSAQLQMQQLQQQYDHEQQLKEIDAQKEITIAKMKTESAERIAMNQSEAKIKVAQDTGTAKIASTELAGQHQQIKQHIANSKPETASV